MFAIRPCITDSASRDTLVRVKTVRLTPELEKRLQRAASVAGESLSEFIRRAAAERADTLLRSGDPQDLDDVLGVVHGGGGRARRAGGAFTDLLVDRERSA